MSTLGKICAGGVLLFAFAFYGLEYDFGLKQGISDFKTNFDEWKSRKSVKLVLGVTIIGVFLVLFLLLLNDSQKKAKEAAENAKKEPTPTSSKYSKDDYDRVLKSNTEKQLRELENTPAYKKMLAERGNDPSQWNWQMRSDNSPTSDIEDSESDDEGKKDR
mmetsp:Transcript_2315/g.2409  ORF Transcript_2315/g.2409 Transcript_2315/m.2409 type:complete len:161 (+) Transcript_2315:130-612(+)|eukprot:CAMPEP_0114988722 /NCGR_PEP_ID=MMETSP0216-20121206/9769_1 /TAXON_ID=223996 /ORGANISM="Protocruzia adherens, Strain Boccale" /LENGTH=160 /DNA_ID=CAMNT_0002351559 /DNA_START=130 /DNA_END=612 /DNA_ORIENTATION=-